MSACKPAGPPAATAALTAVTLAAALPAGDAASATWTPAPGLTPTPPPSETPSPLPSPSPTPDPYWIYTIDHLSEREYGGGLIEVVDVMAENSWFTRYLIRYPSDGLWIYGFLNLPEPGGPAGEPPYPVIIALHGYIDPAIYDTLDYTTGYADALARAGYTVFHPNLRGYPPSDSGDNLFRVGFAIDVLNLIALVKTNAVDSELLDNANPDRIGLWGHSMGGGISTRVLTVSADVQAAVLYAAMSGDEAQNFAAISVWSGGMRGQEELSVPEVELSRISPMYFFDRITAEVQIHHGRADELIPLAWSVRTCESMALLDLDVVCFYYDGMPHTFFGDGDDRFMQNTIGFFDDVLKAP